MSTKGLRQGVFGLEVAGAHLPGLVAIDEADRPVVDADVVRLTELHAYWGGAALPTETLFERRFSDGAPFLLIERREDTGYRIWALGLGEHLVALDGSTVRCHIPDVPLWGPLRLLAAQVYPLLALLHGIEVLHAAAVTIRDGEVLALTAPSGTGKSSTLVNLMARGAGFVTDDALALTSSSGAVLAHLGPRLLSVPPAAYASLDAAGRAALGRSIGFDQKHFLLPEMSRSRTRLTSLAFLERTDAGGREEVEIVRSGLDWLLRCSTVPWLNGPARLVRQMSLAADIDREVRLARVHIAPGRSPADIADVLMARL